MFGHRGAIKWILKSERHVQGRSSWMIWVVTIAAAADDAGEDLGELEAVESRDDVELNDNLRNPSHSLKYGCLIASDAEILSPGLNLSIFCK